MNDMGIIGGTLIVVGGAAAVGAAVMRGRMASSALAFLTDTSADVADPADPVVDPEAMAPVVERLLHPLAQRLTGGIRSLYPSTRLDKIHRQLLYAGMATKLRAEEFATLQVLAMAIGAACDIALLALASGSLLLRFVLVVLVGLVSFMGPQSWLSRKVEARTKSINRELPDMLDLLTISVEAGLGLEAAMDTASSDGTSPLAEEFARTLQEMGLGLSRYQALENMKNRVDSDDLKTFVLVLAQADTLGMPIGRVLRTQADEMRERRRARARELAAKLPVKILFPLMAFILPPLMIVILGPAASSISKMFSRIG